MIDKGTPSRRFGRSRAFLLIVLAALAGTAVAREKTSWSKQVKFGACGEATIRQTGDELIIETLGACHAIDEQEELDACNESLRRDYSFRNGQLKEILRGE